MREDDPQNLITIENTRRLSRTLERGKGNFAFLIGAGTSKEAGIQTSNELVNKWINEEYNIITTDKSRENWVEGMENEMDEYQNRYGFWFEQRYITREERRQYIKSTVSDADPTFEHVVLASIMRDGYVPITLTPNFDDLLYDAFYLYLEERPFLVDHNAIAPQFRITHEDPMIVKLHGDYLYDNLKNTAKETNELEDNIENVLKTTLSEYGIVVLGYSGRDESIMNVLNSDDIEIPDYGLFWCTIDKEEISPEVSKLMEKKNTFLVEIDSSKDFFYDIYDNLEKLTVPTPVDIRENAQTRANQLQKDIVQVGVLEVLTLASEYSRRDEEENAIKLLTNAIDDGQQDPRLFTRRGSIYDDIDEFESAINDYNTAIELYRNSEENYSEEHPEEITDEEIALRVLSGRAIIYARNGKFEKALEDFNEYHEHRPDDVTNLNNMAEASILTGDIEEGVDLAKKSLELSEAPIDKANSKMMIIIGKILSGQNYEEERKEFNKIIENNISGGWNFSEIYEYMENKELESNKQSSIEEIIDEYKNHESDEEERWHLKFSSD